MTTDYISSSTIIPCLQLVQRCVENSVENMHTDVKGWQKEHQSDNQKGFLIYYN